MKMARVRFLLAEDGLRDIGVTGVQTCALPISGPRRRRGGAQPRPLDRFVGRGAKGEGRRATDHGPQQLSPLGQLGRATWRERVKISAAAESLQKKHRRNVQTYVQLG